MNAPRMHMHALRTRPSAARAINVITGLGQGASATVALGAGQYEACDPGASGFKKAEC